MFLNEKQVENFRSGVDVRGEDDCWEWKRCCRDGYGQFKLNDRAESAHRVAWVLEFGWLPEMFEGLPAMVCHSCDNPKCCNPRHLFLGNSRINMVDSAKKGRSAGFRRKGEGNPRALVTNVQVQEIRQHLWEGKLRQREIAVIYGVSRRVIAEITSGKHWSHIKLDDEG